MPVTLVMPLSSFGVSPFGRTVTPIPVGSRTAFGPMASFAPPYETVAAIPGATTCW
ncbi:hypothetical protein KBX37_08325 [Micromonospora sp. U56]|uniref:hypothetical protein n=1 Tax=Micromonospora sp. U56 TaxID=2824900 RepID=UPI001B372DE9|nr:hypothetical protein [Micromonospora sp. U56]MBQ0893104.1 hypothetical protein [Micromonospora sp. U56]